MIHFIGFRNEEYWSAVKIWGKPDFVHLTHDRRLYGDVDAERDTLVFGPKADPDYVCPFSWQDHQIW